MELTEVVRRRRMVRAFEQRPVPRETVDALLDLARRSPSAGNTQSVVFVVLEGDETARFWDITYPEERRGSFRWSAMFDAPVIILPLVSEQDYLDRYSEPDKASADLGGSADAWPVPFWWVDGGMAVQTLLLAAVDAGLGALFFGIFDDNEAELLTELDVPDRFRALGAVALGWPAPDEAGTSASRPRPPLAEVIHRGHFRSGSADGVITT